MQIELVLFFDFLDAVPKISLKVNHFLKILSNLDISTVKVYMAKKAFPSIIQRALQTSAAAVVLNPLHIIF